MSGLFFFFFGRDGVGCGWRWGGVGSRFFRKGARKDVCSFGLRNFSGLRARDCNGEAPWMKFLGGSFGIPVWGAGAEGDVVLRHHLVVGVGLGRAPLGPWALSCRRRSRFGDDDQLGVAAAARPRAESVLRRGFRSKLWGLLSRRVVCCRHVSSPRLGPLFGEAIQVPGNLRRLRRWELAVWWFWGGWDQNWISSRHLRGSVHSLNA